MDINEDEKTPFNLSDIIATVSLVETISNNDISKEEITEVVNIVIKKSKGKRKKHFQIDKIHYWQINIEIENLSFKDNKSANIFLREIS